jgi:hypothetical protein
MNFGFMTTKIRQLEVGGEITVLGHSGDWRDLITGEVDIRAVGGSPRQFGAEKMSRLVFELKCSEIDSTSPEREWLSFLVMEGYTLEELECEFTTGDRAGFGKCTYLKEHPAYKQKIPEEVPKEHWKTPSIWYAHFMTEHAGEQQINFISTQGVPFHKTMVFHKVVLRPPQA